MTNNYLLMIVQFLDQTLNDQFIARNMDDVQYEHKFSPCAVA
jgi:hypothetical protein